MRPWTVVFSMLAVSPLLVITADAQGRGRGGMRFAGMDRNNDGVIARSEWRGSDASFRTNDWNQDGVLSGDEVRPGARRPAPEIEQPERYSYDDWTAEGFVELDRNRDGRISRDEWRFDREEFDRADRNADGRLSRREFLSGDDDDDDRGDSFDDLDVNNDRRISRAEWNGARARFDALDRNRDGFLSRVETVASDEPPPDLFTSVDTNRDSTITLDEWQWSRQSFDQRDANVDGRLTRQEFSGAPPAPSQTPAFKAGHDRGAAEGLAAGREDRERNQGWDLEGQRELEQADSGYEPRFGPRADYQAGYRDGFRKSYVEGYGKR